MTAFAASPTAILGKAPNQAEFLRVHGGDPELSHFDAWLVESMEWAAAHSGAAWPTAFAGAPMHAFAFRLHGTESRVVAGVLVPSADSAGRQFPLVVAAATRFSDALVETPQVLPLALEGFWAEAGELASGIQAGMHAELHAAAARLLARPDLGVEEAFAMYGGWARGLPLAELWALLGPPFSDAAPSLRLLLAALEPFRSQERPDTRLSLRLPLGRAGGVALCFWIDLVRRALGWHHTVPSFFWSHDGERGQVLLHLGIPPRATLAELFMPTGGRDELCELCEPVRASVLAALPPLTPALERALASPDSTAEHLLLAVESV